MPNLGNTGYLGCDTSIPERCSRLGTRAKAAYKPKRGLLDGNQGIGATTRASIWLPDNNCFSLVSTKMP